MAHPLPHASNGPRVVFDCNVFLQAMARDTGPAFACLVLAERRLVTLYVSREILAEVKEVLTRPALLRKFPVLTPARVTAFFRRVRTTAVVLDPVPTRIEYPRDPKDEPYLNLALACDATFLISRDRDLLALQDLPEGNRQELLSQLTILDPVTFLHLFRSQPSSLPDVLHTDH